MLTGREILAGAGAGLFMIVFFGAIFGFGITIITPAPANADMAIDRRFNTYVTPVCLQHGAVEDRPSATGADYSRSTIGEIRARQKTVQ